jgi:hypothetical protein
MFIDIIYFTYDSKNVNLCLSKQGDHMILKMFLVVLTAFPAMSYAAIEESSSSYKEFVLKNESCEHDFKSLAISLCKIDSSSIKEIHRDQFRMQTQAEDSLDEWGTFATTWMGIIKVHRFTDFNERASSDANKDYCYIEVSCYN